MNICELSCKSRSGHPWNSNATHLICSRHPSLLYSQIRRTTLSSNEVWRSRIHLAKRLAHSRRLRMLQISWASSPVTKQSSSLANALPLTAVASASERGERAAKHAGTQGAGRFGAHAGWWGWGGVERPSRSLPCAPLAQFSQVLAHEHELPRLSALRSPLSRGLLSSVSAASCRAAPSLARSRLPCRCVVVTWLLVVGCW